MLYTTYGKIQNYITSYYELTGLKIQFTEAIRRMFSQGALDTHSDPTHIHLNYSEQDLKDIDSFVDQIPIMISDDIVKHNYHLVKENDMIPEQRDIMIIRHPRYTKTMKHQHDYFEVNYVSKGSCKFIFEDIEKVIDSGEIFIIAPYSNHDISIIDDSTVFTITLRSSTFESNFFSLLANNNLFACFFRTLLYGDEHPNYLSFKIVETFSIDRLILEMLIEFHRNDRYSNACCNQLINLIFSRILRGYEESVELYNYDLGYDFSLVLLFIQHNYHDLTLSTLASTFHYSEPYLSNLIKINTGKTFSELIKSLRISEAIDYLIKTDLKINEIAECIGYNSADHFSRVFKSVYHQSPLKYRQKFKQNQFTNIFDSF